MRNKTQGAILRTNQDLRTGLAQIYAQTKSWRITGYAIRTSGAHARMLVNGERQPTKRILVAWQEFVSGRRVEYKETQVCPSCLRLGKQIVHDVGDCHGQPIAAVVLLAPGESVKRPSQPRKRKRYHRPCMDDAEYALWLEFKAQHCVSSQ